MTASFWEPNAGAYQSTLNQILTILIGPGVYKGIWTLGTTYPAGSYVLYGTQLYRAVNTIVNSTIFPPNDTVNWVATNVPTGAFQKESVAVIEGQTAVTVPFTYNPGTNTLGVFINGIEQSGGYTETNSTTVTFDEGLPAGLVEFWNLNTALIGIADSTNISSIDTRFPTFLKTLSQLISGSEVPVTRFGLLGNGVQNNGTLFTNMITSVLSLGTLGNFNERVGVTLVFPGGDFKFENTGLIPYIDNGTSGRNLTIKGAGYGTVLTKVTGTGNGALIHMLGDPSTSLNTNRVAQIKLQQLTVDGSNEAITYGIFLQKTGRIKLENIRAIRCNSGLYAVASSEVKVDSADFLGCLYNIRLDGRKTPDIWGVNTSIASDRGFIENFKLQNVNSYLPATNGFCIDLNHCQNTFFYDAYIATNGATTQHARIRSVGTSGADASTNNVIFRDAFFEFDANSTSGGAVDIQALDTANIAAVKLQDCQWTSLSINTRAFVVSGINGGTQLGNIVDTLLKDNRIYYTAGNTYPALIREDSTVCKGTKIEGNSPMGIVGGSTYGRQTEFADFKQALTDINVRPAAVAEGAAFPGIGGTGWSGSVGTTAIRRATNGESFEGVQTLRLGDGATAGTLTLDYTLDIARFREKTILITFMVQSNSTGQFMGLFPNGAAPDLAVSDFYFSRINQKNSLTVAEANGTTWTRVAFVIPVNAVAPGGSGNFGTASTCTLLIRFQRASAIATDFVAFSDIQVWESNRFFNRIQYN